MREDDEFLQAVTALSTRAGPVSSALTAAAREFKGGRSLAEATTEFIETLKTAIAQGLLRRFSSGTRTGLPGQPDRRQDPAAQEGDRGATGQVSRRPTVDVTDQGLQPVIPGAERITDRELLERRGDQPLRAKKRQKEADFGLFGDEKNQGELFSRGTGRPRSLPQAAPRTAFQLAQAARDFSPMKRLFEGAGLRLRVIDANRLGITLDEIGGRRVPALRALTISSLGSRPRPGIRAGPLSFTHQFLHHPRSIPGLRNSSVMFAQVRFVSHTGQSQRLRDFRRPWLSP